MIGDLISAGASLLGGWLGQKSQDKNAERNIKLQKDFAQKGIQWKAADALKAGIHPLYAMGAQTNAFAPVSVGDSLGPAISSAGQDIGRAVSTGMTAPDKASKIVQALSVERAGLENELLRSQIRQINAAGSPPGMPTLGNNADPIVVGGKEVSRSPLFSDAATFQQRYGEPAEWIMAAPIAAADFVRSLDTRPSAAYGHSPTINDFLKWWKGGD